jgi:hypothetical protein
MNAIRKLGYLGLTFAAWWTAPVTGLAAPCSGTNINNTLSWEEIEIAEGSKLGIWRGASVVVSDDAKAPYHLIAGECIGTNLMTPDGNVRGSGFCARRDKDGDVLYEEWVQPAGSVTEIGSVGKGTWKNVGGTGKFANAADTAKWEDIMSQGNHGAVRWEGDCK